MVPLGLSLSKALTPMFQRTCPELVVRRACPELVEGLTTTGVTSNGWFRSPELVEGPYPQWCTGHIRKLTHRSPQCQTLTCRGQAHYTNMPTEHLKF